MLAKSVVLEAPLTVFVAAVVTLFAHQVFVTVSIAVYPAQVGVAESVQPAGVETIVYPQRNPATIPHPQGIPTVEQLVLAAVATFVST